MFEREFSIRIRVVLLRILEITLGVRVLLAYNEVCVEVSDELEIRSRTTSTYEEKNHLTT